MEIKSSMENHERPHQAKGGENKPPITPSTSVESLSSVGNFNGFVEEDVLAAAQEGQENLKQFPTISFGHFPTPLEYCPRLSKALGGVEIYVKRDDCTGLASGGNKTRKLEFLMAEAVQEGADYVMTHGATQSNHVAQTAAAAAKLGLKCHILLEDRTGFKSSEYNNNGNVLLDDLFGATREKRGPGLDMNQELEDVAEKYRQELGAKVFTITGGGSNPTGALGHVDCAFEMIKQFHEKDLQIDHIVHATGSCGTQAGLVSGLKAAGSGINVLGFGVRATKEKQEEKVFMLAERTAEKIGRPGCVHRTDIVAECDYVGEGYGFPTEGSIEAVRMFAELEGLLLDPVYTGKAAAGLIDYCRKGHFQKGEKVVFVHTGGAVILHTYADSFK